MGGVWSSGTESQCYCANVGDSRAILSINNGKRIEPLSRDHKPSDPKEQKRVITAGGRIYANAIPNPAALQKTPGLSQSPSTQNVILASGPTRVLPGRLSVSRSFGDIEAKLQKFGGNDKVVIADPEISEFTIDKEHDFILLGSDGIFDKLSNEEITNCVWSSVRKNAKEKNGSSIHELCGGAVEEVIKLAMTKNSLDNVTAVLVCLKGLKQALKSKAGRSEALGSRNRNGRGSASQAQLRLS